MSLRDDNYLFINLLICITHTGPKFSISCDHVKVIDTTGMNISFETEESESTLLSAEVHTMWQHVKMVSSPANLYTLKTVIRSLPVAV